MTDEDICKAIHYPKCWDTMTYPTLASALWEIFDQAVGRTGAPCPMRCPTCFEPFGVIE